MNEVADHPLDADVLTREALSWVVRLRSGASTVADADALKEWRSLSSRHEEAFKAAVRLWRSIGAAAEQSSNASAQQNLRLHGVRISRRAMISSALAASVTAALVVRPPYGLWPSIGEAIANMDADVRTEIGKQQQLALIQGVALQINTRTSVAFSKDAAHPGFNLIDGEAFVDSTASAAQIRISAADGTVRFANARINVRRDGGDVRVTCVDGHAFVSCNGKTTEVGPQQQATYSSAGLGTVQSIDVSAITAWRSGLMVFRDQPLSEVIKEVNRYRTAPIILANASLSNRRVSGTFHLNRLEEVVTQVRQVYGARASTLPGGIIVLS